VSSIGGRVTYPFISLYHGTKWAVEGFSESLSYELGELGIQVKIIEPGGVDTDFGGRSMDFCVQEGLTDYDEAMGKFQTNRASSGLGMSTPEFLAEGIYAAATDGKTQLRYLIGEDAEQLYAMRQRVGDDGFVAGMRQQMLS
jgi:short-subunit dehydrogenase